MSVTLSKQCILAIDPSLRSTGFAVLEEHQGKVCALDYGVIKNGPKLSVPACLLAIHERLSGVIKEYQVEALALESVIYVQSYPTAIVLGAARGAALLAAAQAGLPIYEYAPKRAKQAVVGSGGATKNQVAFMVRALLGLRETPVSDAADAMAIGLTHLRGIVTPLASQPRSKARTWRQIKLPS